MELILPAVYSSQEVYSQDVPYHSIVPMAFRWYDGANTPSGILVSTRRKLRDPPLSHIR